jgi:hypothetical protein
MAVSLIETLRHGGCYWKLDQIDSPGHSIAVPNHTPFKIALEGAQSHQYASGAIGDGYFVVNDPRYSGTKFKSANEAVNTVREPSTNAFLYLHFMIDGQWIVADDYRRREDTRLDDAEELALEWTLKALRNHPKLKGKDRVQITRAAANLIAKRPESVASAREYLAEEARVLDGIDLSEIDRARPT